MGDRGVDFIHLLGLFADDVISAWLAHLQFVQDRSVMEKGAAREADIFEGTHAAINRDEVAAYLIIDVRVDLLNTRRFSLAQEDIENSDSWLGDPHAGGLHFSLSLFETGRVWLVALAGSS